MAKIFLSYRRDDTSGYAGRITEQLARVFGADNVFRDIDDIKPGVDFTVEISKNVGACDTLLALIGPRWLSAASAAGTRRLDDPNDFVRLEIVAALDRKVRVIPVLVGKGVMPAAAELPDPLRGLALHQAVEITDSRWDFDMGQLIVALGGKPSGAASAKPRWALPAAGLAVVILAAAGWSYWQQRVPADATKTAAKIAPAIQSFQQKTPANAAKAVAPGLSGKWVARIEPQQGKPWRIQFDFEVMGDRLMGIVHYPAGDGAIEDGKIDGDRLLFLTRHIPQFESQEVTTSFVGKVSGDSIEFVMQYRNGVRRFVASRAAAGTQ